MTSRYQYTGIKKTILVKSKKVIIEFYTTFNPRNRNILNSLSQKKNLPPLPLIDNLSTLNYIFNYFGDICKLAIGKLFMKYYDEIPNLTTVHIGTNISYKEKGVYYTKISSYRNIYFYVGFIHFLEIYKNSLRLYERIDNGYISSFILEIIEHEFVHHLDRRFTILIEKYGETYTKWESKNIVCKSSYILFGLFYHIRVECITKTTEGYSKYNAIRTDNTVLTELFDICTNLSNLKEYDFDSIYKSAICHEVGYSIGNIILLYLFLKYGKSDNLFILNVGLDRNNSERYIPLIKNFRNYYNYKDIITVVYGMPPIYDTTIANLFIKTIQKLNHTQFLELYETSCKKLKIKPLITANYYKKLQKKCYKNYRKLVERNFVR